MAFLFAGGLIAIALFILAAKASVELAARIVEKIYQLKKEFKEVKEVESP